MTDLELTRACAVAMGWHTGKLASKVVAYPVSECAIIAGNDRGGESVYDPLHDDAQCMALVKAFSLDVTWGPGMLRWTVGEFRFGREKGMSGKDGLYCKADDISLNRAVCLCVAKLTAADPTAAGVG